MHLGVVLLFCLTTVGHVALLLITLNMLFRHMRSERVWAMWVAIHGVLVVAIPILFWSRYYVHGPHVLRTGDPARLPPLIIAYSITTLIALTYVLSVIVRRYFAKPPQALRSNHTTRIDVARDLGHAPSGRCVGALISKLPLNDLFQLELVDKQIVLPRLPAEWDGLTILHLTDLHFKGTPDLAFYVRAFELARRHWPTPPDLIALTGDVLDDPSLLEWIIPVLGPLEAALGRFFILGNHDRIHDTSPTRRALANLGWLDVAQRTIPIEHRGRAILVAGSEWPWIGDHPDVPPPADEDEFRLVLAHSPHAMRWAKRHQVDLLLAGHLHGGQIRVPGLGAIIGGRYASGTFAEPPTVMHVSKGLGALTPLRIACPPDLTRLTLRCLGEGGEAGATALFYPECVLPR